MNRTAFYYDNRSNLKCVLDPDNGLTYYTYDSLNRMTSVKNPWGEVTQYEYSPGGRLLKRILGNGTMAYYSYDAVGQVSKVQNVKSNLTTISSFEYQRDALGSPISIKREDNSVTYYEYDAKEQLTKETQVNGQGQQVYGWTWDYDLAGNRLHQTFNGVTTAYTYNAANELTQETTAGATTYFSYDHCGNTMAKIEPGGTTQYHWDREKLMTQVDLPNGGHNYFAYDADAKRVEKRDSDGYTRFVYQGPDMLKLLQERDASDARQAQYTMGNGLEAMRRGSTSSFYHYDWLGSTFELTNAAEAVTDTYLYNAWGEVLSQTGTTDNPHTHVGKERYYRALAAGLFLLGRRYYGSCDARFLSLDPRRYALHWYAYAGNSPTLTADPGGLQPVKTGAPKLLTCCASPVSNRAIRDRLQVLVAGWMTFVQNRGQGSGEYRAGDYPYTQCEERQPPRPTSGLPWVHIPTNFDNACVRYCVTKHEMHHAWQCHNWGTAEFYRRAGAKGDAFEEREAMEAPAWQKEFECLSGFLRACLANDRYTFQYADYFRTDNWANDKTWPSGPPPAGE